MQWHPELEKSFSLMWADYTSFNPHALAIYNDILAAEQKANASVDSLVNDHIALRTIDLSPIDLDQMAAFFTERGYRANGVYEFKEKKLFARHYEHADGNRPKIFISHLLTRSFSAELQSEMAKIAKMYSASDVTQVGFHSSGKRWQASKAVYSRLLKESEYAAWFYAFGFRCNHFTVSVNHLKAFSGLPALNEFVTSRGHKLNASGGLIKGTEAELLEQSSTLAGEVDLEFIEGRERIPACYYEFAKRYAHPKTGQLYTGFIAASADKIFESTDRSQLR